MKVLSVFGTLALAGPAVAWYGQMSADGYNHGEGGQVSQEIHLLDYTTGSKYDGFLVGGFNGCTTTECDIYFQELPAPGGYDFSAKIWRTSDGCHNIDFEGAFDAGHGFCCGSLPCDIRA